MECFEKGIVTFFAGGTGTSVFFHGYDQQCCVPLRSRRRPCYLAKASGRRVRQRSRRRTPHAKKYDEVSIQEVIDKKLHGGGYDGVHHVYGEPHADATYSA